MERYVRSILLAFMVMIGSLSGYASGDFTPLERIPLVGNGDDGIVAWQRVHEMSLLNPLAVQLNIAPFKAFYNLASRDFIDGQVVHGHEIYGMRGDNNRTIEGFRNFSALLNNDNLSLSGFAIRFETVTLGSDTSGIEWEENATTNEEWRIYSGVAGTKANIYLDDYKIVSCDLSTLYLTLQHHVILDTADDAVSGYSEPCLPVDATDVNTPQMYKDAAKAFITDVSENAIRFNFASIQTIPTFGEIGYYIVENAFVELNATSTLSHVENNTTSGNPSLGMFDGLRLYEVASNGSSITQYDFNATSIHTQLLNNPNSGTDDNYSITNEGYLDLYYAEYNLHFYYRVDDQNNSGLLMSSAVDPYNGGWSHQEFYYYNLDDANRTMMLRQPVVITAENIVGKWMI